MALGRKIALNVDAQTSLCFGPGLYTLLRGPLLAFFSLPLGVFEYSQRDHEMAQALPSLERS